MVTSSHDLVDNHFVTISPNPASEILNIRIDNDWSGRVELAIYNSQGQQVIQRFLDKAVRDHQLSILIDQLAAGQYYLLLSNGLQVTSKKVLVDD